MLYQGFGGVMQLKKPGWVRSYKTFIPVGCTVVLFVITITVMIFSFRAHIINEKKLKIRELVETAYSILTAYNDRVMRGELSKDEAKKRALQITSKLRYGPGMKDYFWITDMYPHQLMHPYHKVPYGYDLSGYKDHHGNRLFVEFRDLVKESGSGYHTYYWQWKDNPKKIVPKISYVKGFKPWGWIIGTGIYTEEVNAEIYSFCLKTLFVCFLIFILIVWLSIIILNREAMVEKNRKEAVQDLRESEKRLKSITDSARDAIIEMGPDECISFWNPAAESLIGYSETEALGRNLHELLMPSEYRDRYKKGFKLFQKTAKGRNIGETTQWNINTKSGLVIPVELSLSQPLKAYDGWRTVGILRDISKRMEAERALRESEEMFKALAEKSQDVITRFNQSGEHTYTNPICTKIMGISLEDILYRTNAQLADLFPHLGFTPELIKLWDESIQKVFETGKSNRVEFDLKGLTFDWILIPEKSKAGDVVSVMTSARDITELKMLHGKLNQAQKMEAIGALAGGIAHDFNNIIQAIFGYAQLAQINSSENPIVQGYIDQLCMACERAKELVQQILAFSRQGKSERRPSDIGLAIKEALKLLRASIPSTIEIRQNVKSNLGTVDADLTQIHQIVMNLCTNAFHAMEKGGGQLDVDLIPVELSTCDSSVHQDIKPGQYLKLTVVDTGHGMDADTISRIFEPYFTTKGVGEGTGIGLATVHGIVKNHGGDIKVYSEPGAGTTFQIFFPLIESRAEKTIEASGFLPKGFEQVLFVDDERSLIDIGKKLLEGLGYKVETRTSSYDALEAFRIQPNKYDLIITDLTMPKMTGEKLSEEIMKIRPDIPIILFTGYSNKITPENAIKIGINKILMKPLNLHELANMVRKVLDEK
jgi:PAS domain S-box-containing protein